jgi:hypothetical protein
LEEVAQARLYLVHDCEEGGVPASKDEEGLRRHGVSRQGKKRKKRKGLFPAAGEHEA